MKPKFLTLDEVLAIHQSRLDRYGGAAGIRDLSLLQSALAMPRQSFSEQYLHSTILEMAAAYLYHLAQNHPFVDGKKRTALAAAGVFLWINHYRLTANEDELTDLVLAVASSRATKADIAVFLQRNTVRTIGRTTKA